MKKATGAILCIVFLICLAATSTTSQETSISAEGKTILAAVPKAYGELKIARGDNVGVALWFEDKNGVVRLVVYDFRRNTASVSLEIPRN